MTGRLIDADAIPWLIEGVADIPVVTREEIDAMPTVDAIPVDYILKRMDEMNSFVTEWGGVAEKDALVDSYVHDVCALARLVYGWRKDNGQAD